MCFGYVCNKSRLYSILFFRNLSACYDRFLVRRDVSEFEVCLILTNLDHVQTERFRYALYRNEAILLARIDVTGLISQ